MTSTSKNRRACEGSEPAVTRCEFEPKQATRNGFFIWLPTILNALAASESSDMKICDVIESQMEVAAKVSKNTTVICEDTIYTSTFEQSIYVSLAFYSMYFIAGALVDFVGKKMLLIVILTVTGMCGVGAHLANNQQTAVILFGIFQMSGACIGLVNAVGVELFPTKYRAMAICLSMMVGRVGAVIGSNLIGWFLEVNCGAGFYLFGLLLVVDGLVCLALPNKKKDKLSSPAVSVQRPEHEL